MKISCEAVEPVTIPVEEESIPIQHYLRQPHRLVNAIADPRLMEELGNDCYRLKMRELNLLNLYHFQPTVVLKVWSDSEGTVYLQSQSCEIRGIDYINDRFWLNVQGKLAVREQDGKIKLKGKAITKVTVDVPPMLLLAPGHLLENAGNSLVKSVLMRIKQRLLSHLIEDYRQWARDEQTPTPQSSLSAENAAS
ncbi:DUF1997 domain-containing protein [Spirulina sp. CS-785/01]|uniref:DUF1997 domain-containing protein n=1 Tax=Spirulina sp. CS-785/01 TaxID=3021716 RepID=UPI00232C95D8|nr:DUF1997 domain-containing protein [Spirulina sp. CS-785/01]MDB9316053.1 DUF1997 domain-containing protein [Spirulina sp. CS-785/01]